jgi:type I restriction enzyme S subunit
MRSNYRKIGDHIREVNVRNKDLTVKTLLGINIDKYCMPSVANIVGTDMASYKIVKPGQFACNRMHVGRDYRLPVALSNIDKEFIVSPAYDVFEVFDENILLPEYLMMWFSRKEFDRNAWFYTDADVRGGLPWKSFCEMELPVPHLEKQIEMVKEYNTIVNRINLNNQLIQKLEETAQTIYKQWFVDFEFPGENGSPYKSSGGLMEKSDLGEIPKGWEYISIQSLIDNKILFKNQDGNHGEIHPKSTDYVQSGIPFIMAKDILHGTINLDSCNFISNEQAKSLRIGFAKTDDVLFTHKGTMGRVAIVPDIKDFIVLTPQVTYYRIRNEQKINKEYLFCLFNSDIFQNILNEQSDQSTRKFLSILNQRLIKILLPSENIMGRFGCIIEPLLKTNRIIALELNKLIKFQDILLSKLARIDNE